MKTSLNTYINETITNIIYWWDDRDMIPVTTKFEEWHYCLLGVEIILSSGRQLSIDTNYFNGMGLKTGIDLQKLIKTTLWMNKQVGRQLPSKLSLTGDTFKF